MSVAARPTDRLPSVLAIGTLDPVQGGAALYDTQDLTSQLGPGDEDREEGQGKRAPDDADNAAVRNEVLPTRSRLQSRHASAVARVCP